MSETEQAMVKGDELEIQEAQTGGEMRALKEMRERLGDEVERLVSELSHVRGQWTQARLEAQRRALHQAEELGALQDRASEAQERATRSELELVAVRREQADKNQAYRSAELEQLRAEINHVRMEQQATANALWEFQRNQVAALAGLARPGPVEGPPSATPKALEHDYITAARSGLMDARWYRNHYRDVLQSGADPVLHYIENGWREGRRPGPAFDGAAYLDCNPDLIALGVNPLVHYQTYGAFELRPIAPINTRTPEATGSTDPTGAPRTPSRLWFFAGDLIEWLNDHDHLTGVGRVTSELLFAGLLVEDAELRLCVLDVASEGLVQLYDWEPIQDLAQRIGRGFSQTEQAVLDASLSRSNASLAPGDHVIFTGVVWTEQYIGLFRRLAAAGIGYSLLVHDIIPLLSAQTGDGGHARVFAEWLRAALETAETIYVSNQAVARDVARWAVAARVRPKARIATVGFGSRLVAPQGGGDMAVLARVERDNFVLCVGTIDPRKNQGALLRIWQELVIRLGPHTCPQLVLVGRDDLSLHSDPAFLSLQKVGKVELLSGLSDREVSALYRACRFTAFPSTSEGYGLPVAESLAYTKLCVASDLPAIRSHAGDLAWYFDPTSIADAINTFERAITSVVEVEAATAHIASNHTFRSWQDTFADIRNLIQLTYAKPVEAPRDREIGAFAGSAVLSERAVLEKAARWCVDVGPEVSILIVNWNAAALTMDCIRQVWAATEGVRYEILIADNGSLEPELAALRNLGQGVRLLEIGCNRFFGEANNIAADAAKGQFVCFLNNDAFVEAGWLSSLREAFNDHPQAGGVGPLFRFPGGRIQEGGGFVDELGYPVRGGRGEAEASAEITRDAVVDYISAAALMVERDLFLRVGGFDLRFEPAYYEDTDLCFKIKAAGKTIVYRPSALVFHIEGASANGDPVAELRRKHLGDLNRAKFVARWGGYLRHRDEGSLAAVRGQLGLAGAKRLAGSPRADLPPAIVYTAEPLTPGGGERYLLTLAEVLLETHQVTLVTPHPYSRSRILDLAADFGLDLLAVQMAVEAEARWEDADLQVVMGNHIIPRVPARARTNLFHCQFPFPMPEPPSAPQREVLQGYDRIIVNSRFTALHVEASINGFQLPDTPISVLPPPSRQLAPSAKDEATLRVLSVGRFFEGGHSKRQDLIIDAFKALVERYRRPVELHLAGSSHPAPQHMAYLADLMMSAEGYPIKFHVNIAPDDLDALYASAHVYWHGTGLGSNLVSEPWAAEHFGISIVEAMSAGAVPFALASGGAREIITHEVDGFLYGSSDMLVEGTLALISGTAERRACMSDAARLRASAFSVEAFAEKFRRLLAEVKAET